MSRCPASGSTRPRGGFCSPRSSPGARVPRTPRSELRVLVEPRGAAGGGWERCLRYVEVGRVGCCCGVWGDTVPAMGCGCPSPPTAPVPVGFAPWVPLAPRGCCGPFVLGFWCEEGSAFGTLCFCWQRAAVVYRGWFSSTLGAQGCPRGVSVLPLRSASSSAAGSCSKSGKCKAIAAPGALNGAEPFLLRAPVPRPPVSALAPCPSGPQVPLWVQQCAAGVPWGGTKPGVLCSVRSRSSSELCCGLRSDPTEPCPRRSRFSCACFHPERPAQPRAWNGLLWCHAWAGAGIPGG